MELATPVGRLVQGKMTMQQRKDIRTKALKVNKDGTPDTGIFFSLAFPKVLPNGQPNLEFDRFWAQIKDVAAASWPAFFPQGANGPCTNLKFSWKYQDGDGFDSSGASVADKPGFAGHHIVKFDTDFHVRCFNEGHFAAIEEIQSPDDVIKRGFWVRVLSCEVKSNMSDVGALEVPGLKIYPKLVSFVARGEQIIGGPDAEAAAAAAPIGWTPPTGDSPIPGPGGLPPSPGIQVPGTNTGRGMVLTPPGKQAAPVFTLNPDLVAQGQTLASLLADGWTEALLVEHGHGTMSTPALKPPLSLKPPVKLAPPVPKVTLNADVAATGATIESLLADGWTLDTLVEHGHATRG